MAERGEAFAHASRNERTETMREMQLFPPTNCHQQYIQMHTAPLLDSSCAATADSDEINLVCGRCASPRT